MSTNKTILTEDEYGRDAVEVSGRLIGVFPEAVKQTCGSFDQTMEQYIGESSLEQIDDDSWYSRAELLEMCTHLRDTVGDQIVERVGRFIPKILDWPTDAVTVSDGLQSLDDWYDGLHRGHEDSIQFQAVETHHVQLTFDTPYPAPFEYGLVRGIGHQFQSRSVQGLVVETETTSDGWSRVVVL